MTAGAAVDIAVPWMADSFVAVALPVTSPENEPVSLDTATEFTVALNVPADVMLAGLIVRLLSEDVSPIGPDMPPPEPLPLAATSVALDTIPNGSIVSTGIRVELPHVCVVPLAVTNERL